MELQDLDKLVDEILDLAREHPIDDARIFVKDRIEKDIVGPAYDDGFNDAKAWERRNVRYRIERRRDAETFYWSDEFKGWGRLGDATIYTESERRAFLERELKGEPNKFPANGIWVVVSNGDGR